MIRIIVDGAAGRMGRRIADLAYQDGNFDIVGGIEVENSPFVGKDIGELLGKENKNAEIVSNLENIIEKAEIVIEFSSPEATLKHARIAADHEKAMVIGTTGLNDEQISEIKKLSALSPIMMAPNMSLGVNIMFNLVKNVAHTLGDGYDIEIVEMHHRLKKDAPSGTALKLGEYAAEGLNRKLSDAAVYSREGLVGERKNGEIGIMSLRGGDVVGDHTVIFAGTGERLEITHKASSRDAFALGALRAAKWVIKQVDGLYSMQDVLGLK